MMRVPGGCLGRVRRWWPRRLSWKSVALFTLIELWWIVLIQRWLLWLRPCRLSRVVLSHLWRLSIRLGLCLRMFGSRLFYRLVRHLTARFWLWVRRHHLSGVTFRLFGGWWLRGVLASL